MCGLIGAAGTLEHFDDDIIKKMILFDYFRGTDATGLARIDRQTEEVKIFKRAVDPITAFDMQSFKDVLRAPASAGIYIGHNRAATKGNAKAHANAHPFQHGDITLTHNGTLSYKCFTDLKVLIERPDIEVDSEALCIAIDMYGIEEVVPILQGAWALVWYDASDKTLNWLRNDERPFWYGYSKDLKKIYWGSEWGIIHAAMSVGTGSVWPNLTKYDMFVDEKEETSFFKTKIDTWYKWDMAKVCKNGFGKTAAITKELKGKEPEKASNYGCGSYDPFGRDIPDGSANNTGDKTGGSSTTTGTGPQEAGTKLSGQSHVTQTHQQKKSSTSTTKSHGNSSVTSKKDNIVVLFGDDNDPMGGVMSRDEFGVLASNGCSWCNASVEYGDPNVTIFERERVVLCSDCCNTEEQDQARFLVENIKHFI